MISVLACLLFQSTPPESAAPAVLASFAIEHVSLLPMDREVVLDDQTMLVREGRIAALGPASEVVIPPDATRIDGSGGFLMPGLADMHVHVWDENDLYLFVANGVTTVRNLFGAPLHLDWRERIEAEMAAEWPRAVAAIHHRVGRLAIGEASVVIAVAAAHRADAFEASRYAIERVKQIAPVWKHEFFDDGEAWVEGATADPDDDVARREARARACA